MPVNFGPTSYSTKVTPGDEPKSPRKTQELVDGKQIGD